MKGYQRCVSAECRGSLPLAAILSILYENRPVFCMTAAYKTFAFAFIKLYRCLKLSNRSTERALFAKLQLDSRVKFYAQTILL